MLAYIVAGVSIAIHAPRNAIGWVLLSIGLFREFRTFVGGYALYGLLAAPWPFPALPGSLWFFANSYLVPLGLIPLVYLLFPSGRFPSPRWRVALWWTAAYLLVNLLAALLKPGPLFLPYAMRPNPFGLDAAGPYADNVIFFTTLAFLLKLILAMITIFFRLRKAHGDER
jgi:hypothetical protein